MVHHPMIIYRRTAFIAQLATAVFLGIAMTAVITIVIDAVSLGRIQSIASATALLISNILPVIIVSCILSIVVFDVISVITRKMGLTPAAAEIPLRNGVEGSPGDLVSSNQKIFFNYPVVLIACVILLASIL